ncbi:MAG: stage III sporulation protein AE [Eubacteriales bacterium]|nr:stage III sporulation protein AE [Eubacteriales bacterium]
MGEIDFGELQEVLDEMLGGVVNFQDMAEKGASGESIFSWSSLAEAFQKLLFRELLEQKQLWVHILILAVAAAVLIHFADVFQNKNVSQISFCMIYMILFLILIASFRSSLQVAEHVLGAMRSFMTALAPAYFLAMMLTSYTMSAGVYYEFILLLVSALQRFLELFVLPCVEIYVLLVLANHLSKEARLGRFAELMELLVGWSLKAALAIVMGFHMIQGMISPAADAFRAMSVSRGLQMVPGVGDVSGSVTDMVLGSAMLIKNGVGAAALAALILLCMVPLVKLGIIMAVYYLLAAVLQPVSDERITGCLAGMACGMRLLFQTVFTVLVLFLLTVALATMMTGR